MKTNKIFILINELEENQFGKMPGLKKPQISFQDLLSMNKNEMLSITLEDVFIGNSAKWKNIKDRIEDYLQLSYLREGKLEIIYYSAYDVLTRLYTNDAEKYFHFYDNCVQRKEIESLVENFPASFDCKFINRSNEIVKKEIQSSKKLVQLTNSKDNHGFKTISNQSNYLRTA